MRRINTIFNLPNKIAEVFPILKTLIGQTHGSAPTPKEPFACFVEAHLHVRPSVGLRNRQIWGKLLFIAVRRHKNNMR